MLLATVAIWAFNFTVTRYVLTHGFEPLAYSTIRYAAAMLIFLPLAYGLERSLSVRRAHLGLVVAAAVLGVWLNQIAFNYALTYTTASTGALIMGTLPIFTALTASAFGVERLSARFVVAGTVAFGGVALVAAGSGGELSGDLAGILLMLATAATWAGYSVALAPLMRRYSAVRLSAVVLAIGFVPLLASGLHQVVRQDYSLEPLVWLCLAFAVLGPLVLTNFLWFTAIDRVGPSRATLATNLQPFLAAVFALAILSERMTVLQVAGGVAIGAGILLARRRPADRVPAGAAHAPARPE